MSFINYVTQIQIDFGAVKLLQAECERVGMHKPLIVTDAGVKTAGVLQKALDALPGLPVTVFDQTPSNPTEAAVRLGDCGTKDTEFGKRQPKVARPRFRDRPALAFLEVVSVGEEAVERFAQRQFHLAQGEIHRLLCP